MRRRSVGRAVPCRHPVSVGGQRGRACRRKSNRWIWGSWRRTTSSRSFRLKVQDTSREGAAGVWASAKQPEGLSQLWTLGGPCLVLYPQFWQLSRVVNGDWTGLDEDEDAHVWEDNWDDDNVEDDFSNQLRAELEKHGYKMETS
uniref:26S proteasome complex subunit SEM1 n=1 Tax=Coturnix japonica TaxID=93934 RepID=A0A8C2TM06_COTJA